MIQEIKQLLFADKAVFNSPITSWMGEILVHEVFKKKGELFADITIYGDRSKLPLENLEDFVLQGIVDRIKITKKAPVYY